MSEVFILKCLMCGSTRMTDSNDNVVECCGCGKHWEVDVLTKLNWELHDKDARIRALEKHIAESEARNESLTMSIIHACERVGCVNASEMADKIVMLEDKLAESCGWLPINECHKIGSEYLVYCAYTNECFCAYWHREREAWVYAYANNGTKVFFTCKPTHFRSIPLVPNSESRKVES